MLINPNNFEFTENEIRNLLHLKPEHIVTKNGGEVIRDNALLQRLYRDYSPTSLAIRLEPDWIVTTNEGSWFIESKKKSKNVETVQLYFNQVYSLSGKRVVYLFPEYSIPAELIPINEIIVPENYKKEFYQMYAERIGKFVIDTQKHGITVKDVKYLEYGSGDPFTPIHDEELLNIIKNNKIKNGGIIV